MTAQQNAALWEKRAEMQRAQVVCWSLLDRRDTPRTLLDQGLERLRRLRVEYVALCASVATADR